MKIGLILEGGAMRGMYTCGVIDTFLDESIKVDGIIGVSAGALFGINYCSKQNGRALRYNKKYINNKGYIGLNSLIKTGNIINKEFAFNKIPFELDIFDEEEFQKSKTDFYATITNVETGQAEYVKIKDTKKQMEVFRATGAMPFVSKIVEIDDKKYLDGALADSIPITKAKELGYDKLIVVLTRPKDYIKKKQPSWMAKVKYKKYPNLVNAINTRYIHYNEQLEKISTLEEQGDIFVIRPSKKIKIKRIEKNQEKLQEMYDLGVRDCIKLLPSLKKYLKDKTKKQANACLNKNR